MGDTALRPISEIHYDMALRFDQGHTDCAFGCDEDACSDLNIGHMQPKAQSVWP